MFYGFKSRWIIFFECIYSRPTTIQLTRNSNIDIIFTGLFLTELFVEAHVITQVASSKVFHCQVQILSILKTGAGVDDERIGEFIQQLFFIHDAADTLFGDDSALWVSYLALDISFMA